MKQKNWFLLLLLPLLAFTVVQDVEVRLDDRGTVSFPQEPRKQNSAGNETWSYRDSGTIYIALIVDYLRMGFDSAQMAKFQVGEQFYTGFRDGILSRLPGGKLVDESSSRLNGYPVRNYKFTMTTQDQSMTYYSRNVFVGTRVYSLSFIEQTDHPDSPERERFFNSLTVK